MYATNVEGGVLQFGTSGLLYRSNKLMYDRRTHTLWEQFGGIPAVGTLAESDLVLQQLPVILTTWADWLASHPDTSVLDDDTGVYSSRFYSPESDPGSAYFEYRQSSEPLFPVWLRSMRLPEKSQVLGVRIDGSAKAYPLQNLASEPVVNDTVGGTDIVVLTGDAGSRVYGRAGVTLTRIDGSTVEDERGRRWRIEEAALVLASDESERLGRIPTHVAYWFGWYQFYPATVVYGHDP